MTKQICPELSTLCRARADLLLPEDDSNFRRLFDLYYSLSYVYYGSNVSATSQIEATVIRVVKFLM